MEYEAVIAAKKALLLEMQKEASTYAWVYGEPKEGVIPDQEQVNYAFAILETEWILNPSLHLS